MTDVFPLKEDELRYTENKEKWGNAEYNRFGTRNRKAKGGVSGRNIANKTKNIRDKRQSISKSKRYIIEEV